MGTEKKENLEEMFDRLDQVIGTLEGAFPCGPRGSASS